MWSRVLEKSKTVIMENISKSKTDSVFINELHSNHDIEFADLLEAAISLKEIGLIRLDVRGDDLELSKK